MRPWRAQGRGSDVGRGWIPGGVGREQSAARIRVAYIGGKRDLNIQCPISNVQGNSPAPSARRRQGYGGQARPPYLTAEQPPGRRPGLQRGRKRRRAAALQIEQPASRRRLAYKIQMRP